jgi:RNA polymerase sigma-70 factor (ECF subfamily)
MAEAISDVQEREFRSGDPAAFARLYDRHAPLMYGVALRVLRDEEEAAEALQEAWVQAWRKRDTVDPSRGNLASWLITLARTRSLDRVRRRSTRDRVTEAAAAEPDFAPADTPHDDARRSEQRRHLAEALASLESNQRTVLELAYFEGLSQSEIAERLQSPLGTVKSWTRAALMQLRQALPAGVWP